MNLKRLLTAIIGVSILLLLNTSCENDRDADEAQLPLQIEDLAKVYAKKQLIINAKEGTENEEVVASIANSKETTLKLKNIVEGIAEVEFTTPLTQKENGTYTFKHQATLNDGTNNIELEFIGAFVGSVQTGSSLILNYKHLKLLSYKDISKEYEAEGLVVNNQKSKKQTAATVTLDENGKGTITLKNLTIGEPDHILNITATEEDKNVFSFIADEDKNENRLVKITGTIEDGILSLNHTYEVTSDVVGDWEMKIEVNAKGEREAELFVSMSNRPVSIVLTRMMVLQAVKALRPVLGDAVESVSLKFQKDGKLKIGYTEMSKENTPSARIVKDEQVQLPVDIDYFVKENVLYLAIPEELLVMGSVALPSLPMEEIKSVLEKNGLYYTFPLHMEKKTDHTLFYIDEVMLVKLLETFGPFIEQMIPEEGFTDVPVLGTISKKTILTHIENLKKAQQFKLGLGFKKITADTEA